MLCLTIMTNYLTTVISLFELDVIDICGDWSELNINDCISEYSHLIDQDELGECERDDEKLDYLETLLNDETFVIRLNDTLLVQAF